MLSSPRLALSILLTMAVAGCDDGNGGFANADLGVFDTGDDAADMLALVNAHRARGAICGGDRMPPVPPLSRDALLEQAAQEHSEDMVARDFFSHTNPDNDEPDDRIRALGYSYGAWGENIAFGSSTVNGVMHQWMTSPDHCRNIMSSSFTEFGMGRQGNYWTQVFGTPG